MDFTETEIHISQTNKGLANSIVSGMDYVFERHETAIALEDDVVLADDYKHFMETCFETYKDNDEVTSVCGAGMGTLIPDDYPHDVYFCHRMSSAISNTHRIRSRSISSDILCISLTRYHLKTQTVYLI